VCVRAGVAGRAADVGPGGLRQRVGHHRPRRQALAARARRHERVRQEMVLDFDSQRPVSLSLTLSLSHFIGPIPWGHSGPLCHALS